MKMLPSGNDDAYCATAAQAAPSGAPTHCRIQDNDEQLGVDTLNPRFAWYFNGINRGEFQTAYRIIVASSRGNLDANCADMWDTGKIASSDQYGIKYTGAALQSTTKYWWKVMTWDKDGNASPWSRPATFITGFLTSGAWTAQWISAAMNTVSVPVMFRREFSINKPVRHATAFICGVGQFECRLNGAKVGDHELDPGWTRYNKRQQYVTFDVTTMLRTGNNAIGVWLADGFMDLGDSDGRYTYFQYSAGHKRMILELHVQYDDGTLETVLSDGRWKSSTGAITYAHAFGGEDHNALLDQPGWDSPGFNDAEWADAQVTVSPGGKLVAQSPPPIKVIETLTPVAITSSESSITVDFGKTYAGIFEITLNGASGRTITITTREDNGEQYKASCRYTLKGGGTEVFRPKFWYFGQKYITIQNASTTSGGNLPCVSKVTGLVLANSAKETGSIVTSSDMLNKILAINKQGILSNMYSVITDCPHREKSPWMNDIGFTAPSYTPLFDVHTLFGKISTDITDAQYPDGMVPSLAPQYPVWDRGFLDSPFYDISAMRFPWLMYQYYGDTEILHTQYAVARNALADITSRASGHIVGYGLGDWLSPNPVSIEFIETCVYYDFVVSMQKWATVIGNTTDADAYAALAANIKNAFNARFWQSSSRSYGSSQTSNAVPLYHGMQPAGQEESVLKALILAITAADYRINCGQNGHGYMLQVLSRYGRDDLVARIHTNPSGPSFGCWVTQGKTNTPESWDGGGSQQHQMNNVIPEWMFGCLAGITPATPGFGEILIKPTSATDYIPTATTCTLETVRGPVVSDWNRSSGLYTLRVSIPANAKAGVSIPTFGKKNVSIAEGGTIIWRNGSPTGTVEGVRFERMENRYPSTHNYVVFSVGSGEYVFTAGTD